MPTKICPDCGAEFYTKSIAVRCERCRAVYQKEQTKRRNKRYHKLWFSIPRNKEKHSEKCKQYYQEHRDYYKEYQRRYYQEKLKHRRKFETTTIEAGGTLVTLYICPKIGFKAMKLPCGDRYECWKEPKCALIPKGKEPVTFRDATTEKSWFQQSKIKPNWEELNEVSV